MKRRGWLAGAMALAGVMEAGIAAQAAILAATPISRMDLPWWRKRHEAKLAELREVKPALIFLGDSITQNWEAKGPQPWKNNAPVWDRFYGDRKAVNLGYVGDTTASLLWRIDNGEVTGIAPKVAVILIGANNMGRVHWSADETLAGIDAVIRELRRRLPKTKLLLLSILPSERSAWVNETTHAVNRGLAAKYGKSADVTFLDVTHVFMKDGKLNTALYYDGLMTPPDPLLHPSTDGMTKLAEAIEPTLSTLLGDKPHH